MKTYIVAGYKAWNKHHFEEILRALPGEWHYLDDPSLLTEDLLRASNPRYIFFVHWSWKVPVAILESYECVCFHMTDVPFGRGGSPLQNLIQRKYTQTKLTALRMVEEFDAGPVYLKEDLPLSGSAEEIYIRASLLCTKMIENIVRTEPKPTPQSGVPVMFKRRTPAQSEICEIVSLADLHDHIRMLDADGYPKAFIEHEGFRFEFSRSALYDGKVVADVTISRTGKTEQP